MMTENIDTSIENEQIHKSTDNLKRITSREYNQRAHSTIRVTIIFATHNGSKKISRMLDSLKNSTLDKNLWKIIAVDNNSTDNTIDTLLSYKNTLPLQILSEPNPGKGRALDTAFPHIEGDLTIITDDDVLPSPDWIEKFLEVAGDNPEYDIFSGLIEPEWEKTPEPWLLKWVDLQPIYALNGNVSSGPISARHVFGPNSAFRTKILPKTYTVDSIDVGPDAKKKQYAMGGDTAFALNLENKGHYAIHSRSPTLRHIIPKGYIEEKWILTRAERYGKGLTHFYPHRYTSRPHICGVPVILLARLLASYLAYFIAKPLPTSKTRWDILWNHKVKKGTTLELLHRWRNSK